VTTIITGIFDICSVFGVSVIRVD